MVLLRTLRACTTAVSSLLAVDGVVDEDRVGTPLLCMMSLPLFIASKFGVVGGIFTVAFPSYYAPAVMTGDTDILRELTIALAHSNIMP